MYKELRVVRDFQLYSTPIHGNYYQKGLSFKPRHLHMKAPSGPKYTMYMVFGPFGHLTELRVEGFDEGLRV